MAVPIKALPSKTLVSGADRLQTSTPPSQGASAQRVAIPFWGGTPSEMSAYNSIAFIIPNVAVCTFSDTKITVAGNGPSVKWDIKPAPGTDGAKETDQGYQPAQFTIDIQIWNRTLFEALERLLSVAKVKPGKTRSVPMQVHYEMLELYGIRDIVIVGTPFPRDAGPQMKSVTFNVLEYFAMPKKRAIEKASIANLRTIFDKQSHVKAASPTKPRVKDSGP